MVSPNAWSQAWPNDSGVDCPYFDCLVQRAIEMKSFGDRLREARAASGLTQEQLGFAIGVTKASISAWENGRETPSFRVLVDLRDALNRSLDELICGRVSAVAEPAATKEGELRATNAQEEALLVRFRALRARKREALLEVLKP